MTTNGPPRRHHFIAQSWIRRFVAADGQLHVFDWQKGEVRAGSSKTIMMIYDLYTVDPEGLLDTSTETGTLGELDDAFPKTLARLTGGERGEEVRGELARYFAAQAIRDPEIIAGYAARAQDYALALLDAISATSYAEFVSNLQKTFPGADLTEAEFDDLRQQGRAVVEAAFENAVETLGSKGGTPDAPFTDLLNDPSGRQIIQDRLLALEWTLASVTGDRHLILGDHGLLFDKGGFDAGLRVPISPRQALLLRPASGGPSCINDADLSDWLVGDLNAESAARARMWLVGEPSELERYRPQVRGVKLPKA